MTYRLLAPAHPVAAPPRRRLAARPAAFALVVVGVLIGAGVLATRLSPAPGPSAATGGVLGATGPPGGSAAARAAGATDGSGASTVPASPSTPSGPRASPPADVLGNGLVVVQRGVPTWRDVLGVWHGQAIVGIRNVGRNAVDLRAPRGRYRVTTAAGDTVAEGELAVAFPGVVPARGTAWLVAGFTLPAAPPGPDLWLVASVTGRRAADAGVTLKVDRVTVSYGRGTVEVRGRASNPEGSAVTDALVGVVLLSPDGRPLAAVVDASSVAKLGPRASRPFLADAPPAPALTAGAVARSVVVGWGRRAG